MIEQLNEKLSLSDPTNYDAAVAEILYCKSLSYTLYQLCRIKSLDIFFTCLPR